MASVTRREPSLFAVRPAGLFCPNQEPDNFAYASSLKAARHQRAALI